MRILMVLPRQPAATGNQVTAARYAQGLTALGHTVQQVEVAADQPAPLARAITDFAPEVVHLLHAYRSGRPWLTLPAAARIPMVVTLTGTDLNHDLNSPEHGAETLRVLDQAAAIINQNPLAVADLTRRFPQWRRRLHFLPPGIVLGSAPLDLRAQLGLDLKTLLLLHPAGLRPVKGNLELLHLFEAVAARRSGFVVAWCGPSLDRDYGERFQAALVNRSWARYLGVLPPATMAAVLSGVDVVLNNSSSEGLSNALLEAAVLGRPMLVRDIPGNAAVVEHGVNGLRYRDQDSFSRHCLALLDDAALRRRLSHPQPERYRPEVEAAALAAIYRALPPLPSP